MSFEETTKIINSKDSEVLLSKSEINEKVTKLGQIISEDYKGKCPILVGVLNGSFIFCADLFRAIYIDCEVDFIKISSYGDAMETSGEVKLLKDIDAHLHDRHVIVVEDIVDSGHSVEYLRKKIELTKPKSLKFFSLWVKDEGAQIPYHIDYIGFKIPNHFGVFYGLDYAQRFRNLPEVYVMNENS